MLYELGKERSFIRKFIEEEKKLIQREDQDQDQVKCQDQVQV